MTEPRTQEEKEALMRKILAGLLMDPENRDRNCSGFRIAMCVGAYYSNGDWLQGVWGPMVDNSYVQSSDSGWQITPAGLEFLKGDPNE